MISRNGVLFWAWSCGRVAFFSSPPLVQTPSRPPLPMTTENATPPTPPASECIKIDGRATAKVIRAELAELASLCRPRTGSPLAWPSFSSAPARTRPFTFV